MIHHLYLRNFKKHESLSINFTEGLNGVFGSNYAGKSTLLYGILYAIGGTSFVPGTQLIRRGCSSGMKAELRFSAGDDTYTVVRTKSTANLHKGEELIATGTTAVNEAMETILGLPLKRFSQLHYAEQKKAHSMLYMGAAELNSTLEELTGVATLSEALKHLAQMRSTTTAVLEELPEVTEEMPDLKAYKKVMGEACDLVTRRRVDSIESSKILESSRQTWSSLNLARIAYDKEQKAVSGLRDSKTLLVASVEDLRERLSEEESKSENTEELTAALADLGNNYDVIKNALADHMTAGRDMKEAKKYIAKLGEEKEALASQGEEVDPCNAAELEDLAITLRQATNRTTELASELKVAKSSLDSCACETCDRPFEGADTDKLEADVARLAPELLKSEEAERLARQLHKGAARRVDALSLLALQTKAVEEKLLAACAGIDAIPAVTEEAALELNERAQSMKDELQLCRDKYALAKAAQELADLLGSKLSNKARQLADVQVELDNRPKVSFSEAEFSSATTSKEAAEEHNSFVMGSLADASTALSWAEAELNKAETLATTIEESSARRTKIEGKLSRVVQLAKFLKLNRDRYSTETWDYFMATASEFARNCTDGAIEGITRTEAGKFVFSEGGYDMDLKEASGAQSSILGLGIQVALSAASQSGLDVLLVDEPTADMDAEHSMATMALLASGRKQVIAISHQNMDSSLCSNVINL